MKQRVDSYRRIVVKCGSSLFCRAGGTLDTRIVDEIAGQIASLLKEGRSVIVVSSGAIALGMHLLRIRERPRQLHDLQAAAAIGQNELMNVYRSALKRKGYLAAQVLLTWEDLDNRRRYLNAKHTLSSLARYGAVPVINENDTVATDEIRFGDNDQLSARVASLVSADLLVILSDVEGLLDRGGRLVKHVCAITPDIKALACPTSKKTCVGGMITKLEAAQIAVTSGIPCVITNGKASGCILSAVKDPSNAGTLFAPRRILAARHRWIAFGSKARGTIIVDDGAKEALLKRKSLLSVGVLEVKGAFMSGAVVAIADRHGVEFAKGKAALSSRQLDKVKGVRTEREVVHCNNIALTCG